MASQADICNLAAAILGKPTITNINEATTVAKAFLPLYDPLRRNGLRGPGVWRFSKKRAALPALTTAPVSGPFTQQFALPTDCLRVLMAGDTYPGLDMSDYRMGPTDAGYSIEGRAILSDLSAPLSLLYISDVTDTTIMDASFVYWLGAELAWWACERLTGSNEKQQLANARRKESLAMGRTSGALEGTPEASADDSWMLSRMQ